MRSLCASLSSSVVHRRVASARRLSFSLLSAQRLADARGSATLSAAEANAASTSGSGDASFVVPAALANRRLDVVLSDRMGDVSR